MKKTIITIIGLFLLCGCSLFYDEYEMPKEVTLITKDISFEVYSEPTVNDLIEDKNVKILNEKEVLDTSDIGKKNITIEYEYEDRKYKYDAGYKVIDTEAPTILKLGGYYYINEGDVTSNNIDFCEDVNYIDNYDINITCKVEGTYDVNEIGTYELKYLISDSSNNVTEEDLIIEVIEPVEDDDEDEDEYEEENYEEETLDFKDIVKNYKTKDNMIGIDISRWQGDIDFEEIKKAGCEFVMIRMAVSNGPDDEIGLDSKYKQNIKNAKKAGLKVGVYVYTSPSTTKEIKKQANFILKELDGTKLDFPIAYDFENWDDVKILKINKHDINNMVKEFYNVVKKDGYDVMIYSSKSKLNTIWQKDKFPIWLAHYTDQTNYDGDYIMWQMADNGKIDGIEHHVDIDIYYKKKE